jgi:hypothetical protein
MTFKRCKVDISNSMLFCLQILQIRQNPWQVASKATAGVPAAAAALKTILCFAQPFCCVCCYCEPMLLAIACMLVLLLLQQVLLLYMLPLLACSCCCSCCSCCCCRRTCAPLRSIMSATVAAP